MGLVNSRRADVDDWLFVSNETTTGSSRQSTRCCEQSGIQFSFIRLKSNTLYKQYKVQSIYKEKQRMETKFKIIKTI